MASCQIQKGHAVVNINYWKQVISSLRLAKSPVFNALKQYACTTPLSILATSCWSRPISHCDSCPSCQEQNWDLPPRLGIKLGIVGLDSPLGSWKDVTVLCPDYGAFPLISPLPSWWTEVSSHPRSCLRLVLKHSFIHSFITTLWFITAIHSFCQVAP